MSMRAALTLMLAVGLRPAGTEPLAGSADADFQGYVQCRRESFLAPKDCNGEFKALVDRLDGEGAGLQTRIRKVDAKGLKEAREASAAYLSQLSSLLERADDLKIEEQDFLRGGTKTKMVSLLGLRTVLEDLGRKADENLSMALRDRDKQLKEGGNQGATPQEDPKKGKLGKIAGDERRLDEEGIKDPEPYKEVGKEYVAAGSPGDAERALSKSLELKKDDPEALSLRSLARSRSGNMEAALADARAALERDPSNKLAGEMAAFASASLRKPAFKEVKRPRPESLWSGPPDGGVPDEAVPGLARGADAGGAREASPLPSSLLGGRPAGAGLFERASRKLELGNFHGALLDATRAIEADRSTPAAWALRARISNRLKNYAAAVADADEALRLDPNNAAALRARAYANYELGNYRQALADLDLAVSLDPSNATGYLYRAMAKEKLGLVREALADYETAARLDPALRPLAEEGARRLRGALSPASGDSPLSEKTVRRWTRAVAAMTSLVLILMGGRVLWGRSTRRGIVLAPARPAGPARTLPSGAVLGGHFRVERELGRGGMGVVYQAYDQTLKRSVAVKQLRVLGDESPEGVLKEARLVAQLKHPNLVPIFSVVEDGGLYLVFEMVEGENLDKVLSRRGRLPLEEAREVLAGVCAAVEYAHSRRIIHRDLKPSNIIVTPRGEAKVMDFGIAHESRTTSRATRTEACGTPQYMAPEQMFGSVSKASDLFALGVTAYELVTGELPFSGLDPQAKTSGLFRSAREANPGLPEGADEFFRKALAPRPEDRFQGAGEFLAAFSGFARGAAKA